MSAVTEGAGVAGCDWAGLVLALDLFSPIFASPIKCFAFSPSPSPSVYNECNLFSACPQMCWIHQSIFTQPLLRYFACMWE